MSTLPFRAAALFAAACFAAAPAVHADSAPTPPDFERADGPGPRGPGRGFDGPGLPFLRGVELSEDQQDRLFAIMHEAAPKRREHEKAQRKAFEALRAASGDGKFDEAKAAAAAQALGQAIAAAELLRVRTDAQVATLLTPQQREAQRQDRGPRGRAQ